MTAQVSSTNVVFLGGARAVRPRPRNSPGRFQDSLALLGRGAPRRRAERALRREHPEREEWTRLRRETIGSIDHELRTPLTCVMGYTELMLGGDVGTLNEEQTQMLRRVAGSAATLMGLLEELLAATDECVTEGRTVDVVELARHVIGQRVIAAAAGPPS